MKARGYYIDQLIDKLASDGGKLIKQAFTQADYDKNKTQNLHDSYGSAVYYEYKLIPRSKRFLERLATSSKYDPYENEYITGRRAVEEFLGQYRPTDDGLQLVVVVVMFYGSILEQGKQGGLGRKYKVITQIGDDVISLADKIKGAKVQIMQDGRING